MGATMSQDGVADARRLELPGVVGRHLGVHRAQRRQQRQVEVAFAQEGQHDALEDGLALVLAHVRGLEAGARLEADRAVLAVRLHVEEDDQPVVEAGPAHAPLVAERLGVGRRLLVADARLGLRVDDDLGAGAGLDGLDDRRRLGLGLLREDARLVVDDDARDRVRVGRPGCAGAARADEQPAEEHRRREPATDRAAATARGQHDRGWQLVMA